MSNFPSPSFIGKLSLQLEAPGQKSCNGWGSCSGDLLVGVDYDGGPESA
jgi:hypothetical protein